MPEESLPDGMQGNPEVEQAQLFQKPPLETVTLTLLYDAQRREIIIPAHSSDEEGDERRHAFQEFLYGLRDEGIRVATSEWLDLQKVLASGKVQSLDDLYVISRALLVKKVTAYPEYDKVFAKMFYHMELPEIEEEYQENTYYEEEQQEEEKEQQETEQAETEPPAEEKEVSEEENLSQEIVKPGSTEEHHGGTDVHKVIKNSKSSGHEGGGKRKRDRRQKDRKKEENNREKSGSGLTRKDSEKKSRRERLEKQPNRQFDTSRLLSYEQFDLALAKLSTIVEEASETPTPRLDEEATVQSIADHAGLPELIWKEESIQKPKVMLMFDVGGTVDDFGHTPVMNKLFEAAKDRFDQLEVYNFHNIIEGDVWPRSDGNWPIHRIPLSEILKRDPDTKVILVGDAWMADYEYWGEADVFDEEGNRANNPGGSESLPQIRKTFDHTVWLNPIPESQHDDWDNSGTIEEIKSIIPMYDLTLDGLEKAVRRLMEE